MSTPRPSTGKLHLLFIRHGETQDNIDKILQGLRDTSLTDKGHREAKILADKMKDEQIDVVYHSPLIRIRQTIEPILASRPGLEVHSDKDLTGQSLGKLEGGSYDTVDMSNPRSADGGPGVENFDDFVRRLLKAMAGIVGHEAPKVEKDDRVVAIATHGVSITSIFKALENSPGCDQFVPQVATRGPNAYEVRWTDSDDVARLVIDQPSELPVSNGLLDWDAISSQPILIEKWGKKEKAL
jgi:broad specificity phosphatase PhoE